MPKVEQMRLALVLTLSLLILQVAEGKDEISKGVLASEILTNISKGLPVEYDHVIVTGNLSLINLKGLHIKHVERTDEDIRRYDASEDVKIVVSPIRINDSVIMGEVRLNNTILENNVNFAGSEFNATADFSFSNFNKIADFSSSRFNRFAFFTSSGFENPADFHSTYFSNITYFSYSNFNDTTDFRFSNFNSPTYFWHSRFNSLADFSSSYFIDTAEFSNSQFNKPADFSSSAFNSNVDFRFSNFNNTADFQNSKFNSNTSFSESVFSKEAKFNDVQFRGLTNFDSSQFKGDAFFENAIFKDTLSFKRTSYNKLYIRWYNIKNLFYDDSAYLALIKNFKDLGYLEDSDNCYFQYRTDRRGQDWKCAYPLEEPARKSIDFLSEWSYGYGTRPVNPFIGSLLLIGLFGFFWRHLVFGKKRNYKDNNIFHSYSFSNSSLNKYGFSEIATLKEISSNSIRSKLRDVLTELGPFGFSATVFLSGTKFLTDPPELPDVPEGSKHMAKQLFTIERILGAIFIGLFLIAISRTIIRAA